MRNDSGHQFSRKVSEWGFRKNVSCSERRKMLQNPRALSNPTLETQDQRVNSGKLQNWGKRYRKEPALSLQFNALENSCKHSSNLEVTSTDEMYHFQSIQILDLSLRKQIILLQDQTIRGLSPLLFKTFLRSKRRLTFLSQYWVPLRVVISGHLVGLQSMYPAPLDCPAFSQRWRLKNLLQCRNCLSAVPKSKPHKQSQLQNCQTSSTKRTKVWCTMSMEQENFSNITPLMTADYVDRFPGEILTRHLWDGVKAH
jgi:hypothetical protein